MTLLFKNRIHDEFGTWPLAYIPYGGADFGEIQAVAQAVGDGDDSAYYAAWNAAADRLAQEAASLLAKGHRQSARDIYLRASVFYATSYHPLYGEPVDTRLLTAFRKQVYTFDRGLSLFDPPIEPVHIALGEASMPAYLIPAQGRERDVRPLLLLTNGYDATITDMYFASAVAASRRGYHCLLFDGPGQGAMLYEHGIRLRPDWETVITPVVDFALTQTIVDPARIALSGWSLGGYLAPRAAAKEHRIAALIADPGTLSMAGGFRDFIVNKLGASREAVSDLGELDPALLERLDAIIRADPDLRWKVVQRGFWVHGVDNLRDYLRCAEEFTMRDHAGQIRCPTLLTMPENDPVASATPAFFQALRCRKTLLCFSASEGAGEHCEMRNRSLLNLRVLDWLDEQFSSRA